MAMKVFNYSIGLIVMVVMQVQNTDLVLGDGSLTNNGSTSNDVTDHKANDSRIVGGTLASKGKYPMFAIPDNGGTGGLCGATIIHQDILVSAAHCEGVFIRAGAVVIGSNKLLYDPANSSSSSNNVIRKKVEKEYPHPLFNTNTLENDIMLIKVSNIDNEANGAVSVAADYNTDPAVPVNGDPVIVIGFGTTSEGGTVSETLLEADLQIVSYSSCADVYSNSGIVDKVMLCAGSPPSDSNPPKDSCQGDSGGPLFREPTTAENGGEASGLVLIGIVSFGEGCGRDGVPGVYTRISSFVDFIKDGICSLSRYPAEYCSTDESNSPYDEGNGSSESVDSSANDTVSFATDAPSITGSISSTGSSYENDDSYDDKTLAPTSENSDVISLDSGSPVPISTTNPTNTLYPNPTNAPSNEEFLETLNPTTVTTVLEGLGSLSCTDANYASCFSLLFANGITVHRFVEEQTCESACVNGDSVKAFLEIGWECGNCPLEDTDDYYYFG